MATSKAKKAEVATRRTQLIRLRRRCVPFDDPQILALGYKTAGAASKDLIRALEQRRDEQAAEASVYRQEENERLDELLAAVWPHATNPIREPKDDDDPEAGPKFDPRAVETALKILDRRAKLNGLDMPARTEVSGPAGGPLQLSDATVHDLHRLIGMAGEPDAAGGDEDAVYDGEQYEDEDQDAEDGA